MSKKLVAGLIGWLILAFFMLSSVWAAANKDKAPVSKKDKPVALQTAGKLNLKDPATIKELKRLAGINWITAQEQIEANEKAYRAELETRSVYDAASAAGVMGGFPDFIPGVAAETASANYDTGGFSYYDLNANHRNPRQIAIVPGSRNVGIAFANSDLANLSVRNVFGSLWVNANKVGGFLGDVPMSAANPPGVGRGGFCGVTYLPRTGKLLIYGHHALAPRGMYAAVEENAGSFDWVNEFHAPDSIAGDLDPAIWPTAAGGYIIDAANYDNDGSTTESLDVVHFFGNEGNTAGTDADHYIYSRGVDSAGTIIFPGFTGIIGMKVDSGKWISATVVTSKKSRRVALIYTSEHACGDSTSRFCSDVHYKESFNGGEDWVTAGSFAAFPSTNITNYASTDQVRAYGDVMGVYDNNDSLVITYVQYVDYEYATDGMSAQTDIIVYTKEFGKRKAVDGNFAAPTNVSLGLDLPSRRFTVNWPHIAVHNGEGLFPGRDNYYYLVYAQWAENNPTFSDTSVQRYVNGEVYVTVSTNAGKTWAAGKNLTKSKTPACAATTCSDVAMASAAELCDDTIHIMYMSDLDAGLGVPPGPQGTTTNNPVIYMKAPAFNATLSTLISLSPTNFILDPGVTLSATKSDTFLVQNIGNTSLMVDSIVEATGSLWLSILNGTGGFTILEGDPNVGIGFTVNDASLSDGVYCDTILVFNNSSNNPAAGVVVIMVVDNINNYVLAQFQNLNNQAGTDSVVVRVSNSSNVGHQDDKAGFYKIFTSGKTGTDTTNMLFEASKFIAMSNPSGDTLAGLFIFDNEFMQPLTDLYVKADTTLSVAKTIITAANDTIVLPTGTNYQYARTDYASIRPDFNDKFPGPWFGWRVREEWWLLPPPTSALIWVQCVWRDTPPSWWADTRIGTDSQNVYIGKVMDWDAFTDTSVAPNPDNYGRRVPGTGLTWVRGANICATFQTDSCLVPSGYFGATAYLGNGSTIDPFAAHVASNPYAIYPTNGYVDEQLMRMAADVSLDTGDFYTGAGYQGKQYKYFLADTAEHDSLPTDLNVVMTDICLTTAFTTDTAYMVNALFVVLDSTANAGCAKLATTYNTIRTTLGLPAIANLASAAKCSTSSCLAKPGDANNSGTYTLGDVISTVNYIFNKPGCTPQPICWLSGLLCRGDWNGSTTVTLGDVIQAVNFIFNKPGGPWTAKCSGTCCTPVCLP